MRENAKALAALVASAVGIAAALGYVSPDAAEAITSNIEAIVGPAVIIAGAVWGLPNKKK